MDYYLSIQYARKNQDGTIPQGFDMEFPDNPEFVGKRVIYPRYSDQIPKTGMKLLSTSENASPFRKNQRMRIETYEITNKTFESMEEKPEIEKFVIDGKKKRYGWSEKSHQDDHSELRRYIIKGYKG